MMRKSWLAVSLAVLAIPSFLWAAKPVATADKAPPAPAVDLFEAMKSGDIDVKLIPKDSTTGVVTITNKTKKPLTIKLKGFKEKSLEVDPKKDVDVSVELKPHRGGARPGRGELEF